MADNRRIIRAMCIVVALSSTILIPTPSTGQQFGALPQIDGNAVYFDHPPIMYDDKNFANVGFASGTPLTPSALPDTFSVPGSTSLPSLQSPNGETIFTEGHPLNEPWPDELVYEPVIRSHKPGSFFQRAGFTMTWLDRPTFQSYGVLELDIFATFAVPLPTAEWPLLITPVFDVRFLDGPPGPNLPNKLYETYVDFTWYPQITERWMLILGVAPSVYSDFEARQVDGFRMTGKGLAKYTWKPEVLEMVAGVLYLNRDDISLLPAGGLIWTPNCDSRYELLFPNPKLARRLVAGPDYEDWIYFAGEFGGNSWDIERPVGFADTVTLRDYRVMIGLERKRDGGAGRILEIGYVFGRRAEFRSGIPDVEVKPTVHMRFGVFF